MEENTTVGPSIEIPSAPIAATPEPAVSAAPVPPTPVAPPPAKPKMNPMIPLVAMGSIILILCVVVLLQWRAGQNGSQVAAPTPTEMPTPTPNLKLAPVATTSAFETFAQGIASLSAQINGFSLQDGALTPPALDSNITFKEE